MDIRGFQKLSLIDYPEKISAIIFTSGCTLRCPFCYNPELVSADPRLPVFSEQEVLEFLKKRKGKLEALVITGGEPTVQTDLPEFISRVKNIGYVVKVDTNGSNPEMLKKLIKKKLVDYVAMDIKTTWKRYKELEPQVSLDKIKESIYILKDLESKPLYEFRTTVVPKLVNKQTIEMIGRTLQGARKYVLQQYRPQKTLERNFDKTVYPTNKLELFKKIVQKYVKKVEVRGV